MSLHFLALDINECDSENGGCEQVCTNSVGSFQCSCNYGFFLEPNNFNCSGMFYYDIVSLHCLHVLTGSSVPNHPYKRHFYTTILKFL